MSDQQETPVFRLEDLKSITPDQLAGLGAGHVGYITRQKTSEGMEYRLYGADGQELATAKTAAAASFAAQHLEIEPVTVH